MLKSKCTNSIHLSYQINLSGHTDSIIMVLKLNRFGSVGHITVTVLVVYTGHCDQVTCQSLLLRVYIQDKVPIMKVRNVLYIIIRYSVENCSIKVLSTFIYLSLFYLIHIYCLANCSP